MTFLDLAERSVRLAETDTFSLYGETYCVMDILSPRGDGSKDDKYFYVIESCTGDDWEVAMRIEASSLDKVMDDDGVVEPGKPLDVREVWPVK